MEAIKAGVEKIRQAVQSKKIEDKLDKAHNPTVKLSERVYAEFDVGKTKSKVEDHGTKLESHKNKYVVH